jgi:putative acetyltransferase
MTPQIRPESLDSPVVKELIQALNAELGGVYPEAGANHFRLDPAEVAPGRGLFLVAYLQGEAVGCGAVRLNSVEEAEIKRMYVAPEWRGRRIAAAVLAQLERHATELGARRLVLEVGERQPDALTLYRRAGFVEIDRFGEYIDSSLSLCMGKPLGP